MVDFQVVVRTSYQYYKTRMFLAHTVKPDEKTKSETERNKTQKQEEKVFQHEQGGYIRILSYRKDQTAQEDKQEHILEHTFPYLKGMHFPPVKHYS
jgi:G3E family GTPase